MNQVQSLVSACASLVILTSIVAGRMLFVRIKEMRTKRISPQSIALSGPKAEKLEDTRAADNFNNLLEVPVLFYALCIMAVATQHIPSWLPTLAWVFVGLRVLHSAIQCTSNKVMHRFRVFFVGFALLVAMWISFAISLNAA